MKTRSPRRSPLDAWPTRRFEILRTRACELPLTLDGTRFGPVVKRVQRDLLRRGLAWMPEVYLSTGWHCPDRVPVVGVPFTLATTELRRIEKEVTGELESRVQMVRLLRHEVGHAINYALRLHETHEWRRHFGPISRPYREQYSVRRGSRQHVRHLPLHYAQKHPDEDFAETFAVWLTPRARWRREYEGWGAVRKLEYVDRMMAAAVGDLPSPTARFRPKVEPLEEITATVARYYQDLGYPMNDYGFQDEAVAYVDEDLKAALRGSRQGGALPGHRALRRVRRRIVTQVCQLLGVRADIAERLYDKYEARASDLGIETGRAAEPRLLVAVSSMMTTHLLNRKHTGRFTRHARLVQCR